MALNIYEPQRFRSQGIEDLATVETLTIHNGKIIVKNVAATESLLVTGASFNEVENKGLRWTDGRKSKSLVYKQGNLFTDMSVNLAEEHTYQINDTSVLSFTELGSTVTKSNLKVVGTLRTLKVSGHTELGEFLYVNSDLNRVGINTDSPKTALSIHDNSVEIGIGSLKNKTAMIGTLSNDALEIIADGVARITVNTNGDIKINGKLYVDQIITDASPLLIFKETKELTNYGKGLIYGQLVGPNKQFVFQGQPDKFWSTESIDLAFEKYYAIENHMVLNKTSLGSTVTHSSLTQLGVLEDLQVAGDAAIARRLSTNSIEIGRFILDEDQLSVRDSFTINRAEVSDFNIAENISIGNSTNSSRTVSVYGKLAVGGANPAQDSVLTVNGTVSFDNKRFKVGSGAPASGQYNKGDIVWNNDPKPSDYIGWVCVTPGTPGVWLPFGAITSR